ncbi:MAG: polysaccharide deacetylase family protein [Pseudomonadales bacterium]|nr:polysaccharide deacetylase family protein [Pseudomonadales bacterium]
MSLKSWLRSCVKGLSVLMTSVNYTRPDVVVLNYHRVTGNLALELDIPFADFSAQMHWLAANTEVISLEQALHLAAGKSDPRQPKDAKAELLDELPGGWISEDPFANARRENRRLKVVLTFDDGYEDFYLLAWPLLKALDLPSTVYIPTEFIQCPDQTPVSRGLLAKVNLSGVDHSAVNGDQVLRPMSWAMLKLLQQSTDVTVAAHSHTHKEYPSLLAKDVVRDIDQAGDLFETYLGCRPKHFSYPRGAWNLSCEKLVRQYYASVALVGGGGFLTDCLDPFRLPRVPVLRSDGLAWFRYRLMGRLVYEEKLAGLLKRRPVVPPVNLQITK